jgi:biopolymer transport protein ExbB
MFGFEWMQKGGPIMYLIALTSVIGFAVVIERLYHLYRARIDTKKFMEGISGALKRNRVIEAIEMCDQTPGPIASILKAGILKHDRSKQEIKESIEEAGLHEIPRLEKNLAILATVSNIAPLLGLLGTVTGMVKAFQVVQQKAGALNPVSPGDLAGGIWEALLTTVFGLMVAIPAIVVYNYLVTKVDSFVLEMERSATELLNLLSERNSSHEV